MTNRDMLYRAILSYPADDAPRLMYADEIADEQPERAEFIRVQCELARTNHAGDCRCSGPDKWTRPECTCEWGRLDNQSGILEFAERRRVFAGIKLDYAGDLTSQFQRGFLAILNCSFADWLAHHERLFWSPGQTVECSCDPWKLMGGGDGCSLCDGTGRIPRPFTVAVECQNCKGAGMVPAPHGDIARRRLCDRCSGQFDSADTPNGLITQSLTTAQPIERVRFTIATWEIEGPKLVERSWPGGAFIRHPDDGRNEWYCDRWPGVIFEMPESERNTRTLMATERIVRGQLVANMHGQPMGFAMHDAGAGEQVQLVTGNL